MKNFFIYTVLCPDMSKMRIFIPPVNVLTEYIYQILEIFQQNLERMLRQPIFLLIYYM